jgi:peptide/nickel transport system substrate-binding protein
MNPRLQQRPVDGARRAFLRNSSLAVLGLAGGGIPCASRAARVAILHIRNYVDVSSLDPVSTVSQGEGMIQRAIQQGLLHYKAGVSWDTRLDAAAQFHQLDATRYRFRLKPGQMFNNGFGEMTADDVKFSFERMIDPAMHALNAADMGPLDRVEVHDRYSGTLRVRSLRFQVLAGPAQDGAGAESGLGGSAGRIR